MGRTLCKFHIGWNSPFRNIEERNSVSGLENVSGNRSCSNNGLENVDENCTVMGPENVSDNQSCSNKGTKNTRPIIISAEVSPQLEPDNQVAKAKRI